MVAREFSIVTSFVINCTLPFFVNFKALLIKFIIIWDNLVGSPIKLSGIFESSCSSKLLLFIMANSFKEF